MTTVPESRAFRIEETGTRLNGLELELHLFFGVWAVVERHEDRWVVATEDGERRTLVPVAD
ncbi:hypothetical protein NDI54_18460 [Haloarcula sp. S1AR25-5A]|uniref:Uncharacterized protein n=1 Tax=Haloarcula terrestris TaxID=2950533 RepID=A0AAE4F1M3_9EURY|nr:hypothetical protein [Haloarcula terrestris]MDS0223329.1 hypothetical protein [Haloarcula terrestris]